MATFDAESSKRDVMRSLLAGKGLSVSNFEENLSVKNQPESTPSRKASSSFSQSSFCTSALLAQVPALQDRIKALELERDAAIDSSAGSKSKVIDLELEVERLRAQVKQLGHNLKLTTDQSAESSCDTREQLERLQNLLRKREYEIELLEEGLKERERRIRDLEWASVNPRPDTPGRPDTSPDPTPGSPPFPEAAEAWAVDEADYDTPPTPHPAVAEVNRLKQERDEALAMVAQLRAQLEEHRVAEQRERDEQVRRDETAAQGNCFGLFCFGRRRKSQQSMVQ